MSQALLEFEPKFVSPKRCWVRAVFGFYFFAVKLKGVRGVGSDFGFSAPPPNSKVLCVFAPYLGFSSLPSYTQAPLSADLPSQLIFGILSS